MKKLLFICLLLSVMGAIKAQDKAKSVYFNVGSGFHNLKYDLANGQHENKMGYTLNLGYNTFFSTNWGVKTGIGLRTFRSNATLNYQTSATSKDTDGESFEFRTKYADWKEKQNILLLDIPLGLIYQLPVCEKWNLQFSFGPKLSFPVKAKHQTTGGSIETTGYYPQYNVVLSGMPQHNFKTLTEFPENDISMKTVISAFADFGGSYKLSEKLDLYLGAYADYGLNNAIDAQKKPLYQEDGVYNGVLSSDQTDKVKLMTFGFKIGLNLNLGAKEETIDDTH